MKVLRFLLLVIILISSLPFFGKDNIEWLNTEYDFGVFSEEDGVRSGEFRFVNKGKKSVTINEVKVSCGCTETLFTKKKIAQGDTAVIKVEYDPAERPGYFDKGVYVYLNDDFAPKRLKIKGTVIASPETLELYYPKQVGNLFFDTLSVNFNEVERGVRKREYIDIYNGGFEIISPIFSTDNEAATLQLHPETIFPGQQSTLTINLDSAKFNWDGDKSFKISGTWGKGETVEIEVKAVVLPHSMK